VRVEWWVPVKKGLNLDEWHLYQDCYNDKWKCNLTNLKQWFDISTILFYFFVQKNTTTKAKQIFLLFVLIELKLISMLLMSQPICEGCWRHWWNYICNFLMSFISYYWLDYCFSFFGIFLLLYGLINLFFAEIYPCTFLKINN
jgi:hypothetical protein